MTRNRKSLAQVEREGMTQKFYLDDNFLLNSFGMPASTSDIVVSHRGITVTNVDYREGWVELLLPESNDIDWNKVYLTYNSDLGISALIGGGISFVM